MSGAALVHRVREQQLENWYRQYSGLRSFALERNCDNLREVFRPFLANEAPSHDTVRVDTKDCELYTSLGGLVLTIRLIGDGDAFFELNDFLSKRLLELNERVK